MNPEEKQGDLVVDQMQAYTRRALELGADAVLLCLRDASDGPILFGLRHDAERCVGCIAEGNNRVHKILSAIGCRGDDIAKAIRYVCAFQSDQPPGGLHFRIVSLRKSVKGSAPWNPDMSFPPRTDA